MIPRTTLTHTTLLLKHDVANEPTVLSFINTGADAPAIGADVNDLIFTKDGNSGELMRLKNNGHVGIGTSTPAGKIPAGGAKLETYLSAGGQGGSHEQGHHMSMRTQLFGDGSDANGVQDPTLVSGLGKRNIAGSAATIFTISVGNSPYMGTLRVEWTAFGGTGNCGKRCFGNLGPPCASAPALPPLSVP